MEGAGTHHPLFSASLLSSLYCSEAAELSVWCDLCDAFQPTRGKLGLINAGHLIPQSAFYLFLKHRAAQTEIVVFVLENLMLKGHVAGEKMPTETFMQVSWGPRVSLKCLVPKTWDVVSPEGTYTPHWKHHLQKDWQLGQWHLKSSICMLVWAGAAGWRKPCTPMASIGLAKKFLWVFLYNGMDKSGMIFFGQPSISTVHTVGQRRAWQVFCVHCFERLKKLVSSSVSLRRGCSWKGICGQAWEQHLLSVQFASLFVLKTLRNGKAHTSHRTPRLIVKVTRSPCREEQTKLQMPQPRKAPC